MPKRKEPDLMAALEASLRPVPPSPAREEREPDDGKWPEEQPRGEFCPRCDGDNPECAVCGLPSPERVTEEETRSKCPKCKGQGHVEVEPYTIADCPKCAGNGWLRLDGSPFPWVFKDRERVTEPRVEEARPRATFYMRGDGTWTVLGYDRIEDWLDEREGSAVEVIVVESNRG